MKLPHKTLEKKLFASGYSLICAVDEVGMGCLAGPVVVCAVGFTNHFYKKVHKKLRWLRDSKLLLSHQREKFAKELISEKDLVYALAHAQPKTIDKLNIYQAARLAMKRAVLRLVNPKSEILNPKQIQKFKNSENSNLDIVSKFVLRASDFKIIVLVDGPHKIAGLDIEQLPVVRGDRKIFAIACASVIAKVFRDKMMIRYAEKYPGYGFEKHKGYGTKYHRVQLASLGPSAIHRRSFKLDY